MDTSQNHYVEYFRITGNWKEQSLELKDKFEELTDSDLEFETGKELALLDKLCLRLNKIREEVVTIIKSGQPEFKHLLGT
jgi:hypothetical protein